MSNHQFRQRAIFWGVYYIIVYMEGVAMGINYLLIDTCDEKLAIKENNIVYWAARNIKSTKVLSMADGIKLASENDYLFVGINTDAINYADGLLLLRAVTPVPIFLSTSNFSIQEHTLVTKLGADLYGMLVDEPEVNYDAVMTHVQHVNLRGERIIAPVKLLAFRNLLMCEQHRLLLVGDTEVELTKIEFRLLKALTINRGRVLTFEELYASVWNIHTYSKTAVLTIKNAVNRLRKKIGDTDDNNQMIISHRGVGFKLAPI